MTVTRFVVGVNVGSKGREHVEDRLLRLAVQLTAMGVILRY